MRRNQKIALARFRISTQELIIEDIQNGPKRTLTSTAPAMTHAAIRKLVADSVVAALEAQAATMENADNTNRNTEEREALELANLCPIMVLNSKKMMEAFIKGLPRSIKGNVTASKPQTLEEAIKIAQRNTTNDKNYHNNHNNDHHQQQNKRQETFRAYAATPTENRRPGSAEIKDFNS
uniref:Ty3 transposon capsid-like protein domain-containing protein n=1 Tax=Tanacetum cinerariifolium TaxID=118510 RepID=A0A6L2KC52_TANCI|nr:hypothetical protein [Tanacetum cinerariifolium]